MKSDEFGGNQLTIEAIVFFCMVDVELARIYSLSYIQTFFHPVPDCPRAHSSREEKATVCRRKWQFGRGWNHWSWLEVQLKRETHTTSTKKTWSEVFVSQSPMLSFWCLDWSSVICYMKMSQVRKGVTGVFVKLFHSSRLTLLLLQSDRFVRGNWNRL